MRPAGFALMGGILVIGSYNRDTVLRLARFPAPGETLTALGMAEFHGGKGSNQAVAAARAGGRVALITAIGDDASGQTARALWATEGIEAQAVQTARAPQIRSSSSPAPMRNWPCCRVLRRPPISRSRSHSLKRRRLSPPRCFARYPARAASSMSRPLRPSCRSFSPRPICWC